VNSLRHIDPPIESDQVRAAAEKRVLAVIDRLIDARIAIGAGPSAEKAAPFGQLHA
jgi:fructose-specific component phosphotransferase system IIB-like protein